MSAAPAARPVRGRRRVRALLRRVCRDRSGTSVLEFALILPVFITLGMFGTELAYMASVNMQASQIALSLADNASRLGQTDNSAVTPTITEADIDSVMDGAIQQGRIFGFAERGRVILSSLERDAATGRQYFHWQRCRGSGTRPSRYGDDAGNNGLSGSRIDGVGSSATQVTAGAGSAVMVAEVYYEYPGLFGSLFADGVVLYQEAAFIIRDDRNLTPGVTGAAGNSEC